MITCFNRPTGGTMFKSGFIHSAIITVLIICLTTACSVMQDDSPAASQISSRAIAVIANAGFESGTISWTPLAGHTLPATSTQVHSGSGAIKLVNTSRSVSQTISGLSPNSWYKLSAWMKTASQLGVKDYGGSTLESTIATSGTYTYYSIIFTTGASQTSATIYIKGAGTNGNGLADDVSLEQIPIPETSPSPSPSASVSPPPTISPSPSPSVSPPPPSSVPSAAPVKLAIPASMVSASTSDTAGGWTPDKSVDGNLATRWAGDGDGAFITYNLGNSKTLSFVKLAFYNGTTRTFTFDIQSSVDGVHFQNLLSGVTSAASNNLQLFDFPDVMASHVRIVGHKNSSNSWNSYQEVEVWGMNGSASPAPSVNPSPSPVPSQNPSPSPLPSAVPADPFLPGIVKTGSYTISGTVAGNSDISAISFLNNQFGVLASDEPLVLQAFSWSASTKKITLLQDIPVLSSGTEPDTEGTASDGNYYYSVGSHGVAGKTGEYSANRYFVTRTAISPTTGLKSANLEKTAALATIFANDATLKSYYKKPLQQRGINLEGMAWRDGMLYFGLRGPNLGGNAFVVAITPGELFSTTTNKAYSLLQVPLGSATGIRDIATIADGFLISAGCSGYETSSTYTSTVDYDENRLFELYYWDGASMIQKIGSFTEQPGKVEALAVIADTSGFVDILVLSDAISNGQPTAYRITRK